MARYVKKIIEYEGYVVGTVDDFNAPDTQLIITSEGNKIVLHKSVQYNVNDGDVFIISDTGEGSVVKTIDIDKRLEIAPTRGVVSVTR